MTTLPKETEERIVKEATDYASYQGTSSRGREETCVNPEEYDGYISGAYSEATRALPLLEALEMIGLPTLGSGSLSYPMGFQEWIDTARDIAKKAVIKYNQQP